MTYGVIIFITNWAEVRMDVIKDGLCIIQQHIFSIENSITNHSCVLGL